MEMDFLNKIIFGKFQTMKLIGKGAYSRVFSVRNIANKKTYAMKVQDRSELYGNLENEAYNLYQLKGLGIPKIISYGHYRKYNVLVMELLGKALDKLFIENINIGEKLRKKDAILAGIQMIDRIEHIHSKNLLHLDIKPDNFLVGEPDSSLLYIIDFGFTKQYKSFRTGKHIQYSKKSFFNGNLLFSSARTMNGIESSRRDDLESLGYVLIHLFSKELPWKNLHYKNKNEYAQKAFRLKKTLPLETLCKDAPKEMIDFMKYVKSLKFEEEPKYDYLRNLLENSIKKYKDPHFSWANKALIKFERNYTMKNNKKKRVSPFSRLFSKLSEKSAMAENVNNFQIINGSKFNTIENENIYKELKTDTLISKNQNYIRNNKSENNEDIPDQLYNDNADEINLENQDLIIRKKSEVTNKNKRIENNINNNIIKLNTYENQDIFNNNEIYPTMGMNTNTLINETINYKFITNLVNSKTNNKNSNNSIKLNYSNKKLSNSQYNKKKYQNYNSYNNVIGAKSMKSSQALNEKNNKIIYLNNYENNGQQNINQSINNSPLQKNIVYKRKFEK